MLVGVLLAVWPHGMEWFRSGGWSYVADPDERLCYLPLISHSYGVHPWKLGDLSLPTGGLCLYPWLQFVPWILLAKLVHAGPLAVLLFWRIWAGASLGFIFYRLGREFLGGPRAALWLALVCLTDHGLMEGRPLDRHLVTVQKVLSGQDGEFFTAWAPYLRQFRLITPGISWVFLGLFVLLLHRARQDWNRRRVLLAAGAFGVLFYAYFYYWAAAGAALVLLAALEWRDWRRYFTIACLGGLIGLPAVLANAQAQRSAAEGWLARLDFYRHIGHLDELRLPRIVFAWWLLASWLVGRRHRDLLPLWALTTAGLALMNQQVITGLQMQNDHFAYVWSMGLALLVYVLALREWRSRTGHRTAWRIAPAALAIVLALGALVLRTAEPLRNQWARLNREGRQQFERERTRTGAARLEPNAVLAGDPAFADFAVILEGQRPLVGGLSLSQRVSDTEWAQRRVLDLLLRGATPQEAATDADTYYGCHFSAMRRTPAEMQQTIEAQHRLAQAIALNPQEWLQRFDVRYVALRSGTQSPVSTLPHWHRLPGGERWQIWERTP